MYKTKWVEMTRNYKPTEGWVAVAACLLDNHPENGLALPRPKWFVREMMCSSNPHK